MLAQNYIISPYQVSATQCVMYDSAPRESIDCLFFLKIVVKKPVLSIQSVSIALPHYKILINVRLAIAATMMPDDGLRTIAGLFPALIPNNSHICWTTTVI